MVVLRKIEKYNCGLVTEGKQVGKLYHICSLSDVVKYITPKDELSASGTYKNWIKGGRTDIISFTRSKSFVVDTGKLMDSTVLVQFEVDGDTLSDNYKVFPYNDFTFNLNGDMIGEKPYEIQNRESEECAIGSIKEFSKYITGITVCVGSISIRYINKINTLLKDSLSFFNSKKSLIKMFPKGDTKLIIPEESCAQPPMLYSSFQMFVDSFSALEKIISGSEITKTLTDTAFTAFDDVAEMECISLFKNSGNTSALYALLKHDPDLVFKDFFIKYHSNLMSELLNYKVVLSMLTGNKKLC